jgi:RNA polymerase sigma-70 factor, ECF subfamily
VPVRPTIPTLVRTARNARLPLQQQHDAFAELVRRFERPALTTAVNLTDDVDVARDVCQDALIDAWRRLPSLREPAAFGGWLLRLVQTHATRWRRRRKMVQPGDEVIAAVADTTDAADPERTFERAEMQRAVWHAVEELTPAQREVVVLFYFLGEPLRTISNATRVPAGTIGKRLHAARIALRRKLPRAIATAFLASAPTAAFTRRVQAGLLGEFEGEYRFPRRPDRPVLIRREGCLLMGYANGQRNVLASSEPDVLHATEFDGDARFQRDRRGRISHFVYYEFGKRLGVARKQPPSKTKTATS